jgi:hypothetical protein
MGAARPARVECWRLLVEPTFDPAGSRHNFGSGTGSRNTAGPAIDTPLGVSLMRQTAVNRPDVRCRLCAIGRSGSRLA